MANDGLKSGQFRADEISGTNVYATTGVTSATLTANNNVHLAAGSPYGNGVIVQFTARSNISGGMFVSASGGLVYAAPASTKHPLGVAQPDTDVASGGTVNVITHGVVPVISDGTIAVGAPAMMGAGAALNTVVAATAASGVRTFGVLDAVGSEGTVFILL